MKTYTNIRYYRQEWMRTLLRIIMFVTFGSTNKYMLTFKMNQAFDEFIDNSKKTLVKNFLFAATVFIVYSFILLKKAGGILDSTYILYEVLFFVMFAVIYLNQVMSLSKTINNTAEEISFADNLITIKTYSFNFFSITDKKVQAITTNTNKVFVKKNPYPLSGASNNNVLVFAANNLNIFIMLNNLPSDFTAVFLQQKKSSEMSN
ncbi:hypothetical protein [Mucilaginibacter sp. R-33]|uniref:hypothetical protein n=1 Tax=Mucilaginibacter sp. R-33 TaxID=3416711 RepID=UPI003CF2421F